MNLSEYKVGDKVDIYVYAEKRPAVVTNVSDEGVEVEIESPMHLMFVEYNDYVSYLDPETYMKRFLIRYAGIIEKIKEQTKGGGNNA